MTRVPPRGACDSHCHVIGPHATYPLAQGAGDIHSHSPAIHLALLDSIGLDRALVVHPSSVYADRHDAMLDALKAGGARYRGVAVAHADVSDAQLDNYAHAGVCALRFVEVRTPQGLRFPGSAGFEDLFKLAPRLKERGMHAQVWAECADIVANARLLTGAGIPVVLDHMGRMQVAAGVADPNFQRLLHMVADGAFWVKLTLCRNSPAVPDYAELRPFHDALVEANPQRLVWGSDWPHLRMGAAAPDVAALLALFRRWVSDEAVERAILAGNPEILFGFPPAGEA